MCDKFYDYLVEMETNFLKLAELLQQKLVALEKFDIDQLDAIIKEEQVFILLSKSFETHIQQFREQLGLQGERLSQVIPELPAQEQPRFRELFARLETATAQVKALNLKCQDLIEERLYSLDKAIKELDKGARATYQQTGGDKAHPEQPPHLFNKSV